MAPSPEKKRARRIRLTLTVSTRRREDHLRRIHAGDRSKIDCACELADTYFAKRAAVQCNCRKRKRGNPRVSAGMCNIGDRDRIYQWRREATELGLSVLSGRSVEEPEDRQWASGKSGGAKTFAIEKRDLNREGKPVGGWFEYRRYRTEADQNNALQGLQKNVVRFEIRLYVAGEEGRYVRPRSEYRIVPPDLS